MACNYAVCTTLLAAMDTLWYNRLILFHPCDPIPVEEPDSSESFTSSYQSSSCSSITEQDFVYSDQSGLTPQQSMNSEFEEREKIIEVLRKTRPSRLNSIKTRSHPSSPTSSTQAKVSRRKRYSGSVKRLQKTMSCKSLGELEVEEVKGFMDLGFRFDSPNLCPRMMSVVPGLQRLGRLDKNELKQVIDQVVCVNISDDGQESVEITRPYLSEAWLIRRPDSPLLNLKVPINSEAADMKKHLKHWAKAVASAVQEVS